MFQYAVPVVKYDRRGYKARARQLLLTQSSAIVVEESKIKQRIDYSNLTGGNGIGVGLGIPLTLHLSCTSYCTHTNPNLSLSWTRTG